MNFRSDVAVKRKMKAGSDVLCVTESRREKKAAKSRKANMDEIVLRREQEEADMKEEKALRKEKRKAQAKKQVATGCLLHPFLAVMTSQHMSFFAC